MAPFWPSRRAADGPRERAERFVAALLAPPSGADVTWLEALGVPEPVARREVAFAVRAVGVIVAARDALDDRTVSEVTHALERALVKGDPVAGATGWSLRAAEYAAAHGSRGSGEGVVRRLARVLVAGAGGTSPEPEAIEAATAFLGRLRVRLNGELGAAFGVASLPDDLPPSALAH